MTDLNEPFTGPPDTGAGQAESPEVGRRIRTLREQQGLSLRALAERCGLSLNAISRIERGVNSPTVASLHLLAQALEVPITEFFQDTTERTVVFVRNGSRMRSHRQGIAIESLGVGLRNQQIEPFLFTLEPGARTGADMITHPGQEFVYCLEGDIVYQIGGETYHLTPGDSVIFDASQPHGFSNPCEQPSRMLIVFESSRGNLAARQRHLDS